MGPRCTSLAIPRVLEEPFCHIYSLFLVLPSVPIAFVLRTCVFAVSHSPRHDARSSPPPRLRGAAPRPSRDGSGPLHLPPPRRPHRQSHPASQPHRLRLPGGLHLGHLVPRAVHLLERRVAHLRHRARPRQAGPALGLRSPGQRLAELGHRLPLRAVPARRRGHGHGDAAERHGGDGAAERLPAHPGGDRDLGRQQRGLGLAAGRVGLRGRDDELERVLLHAGLHGAAERYDGLLPGPAAHDQRDLQHHDGHLQERLYQFVLPSSPLPSPPLPSNHTNTPHSSLRPPQRGLHPQRHQLQRLLPPHPHHPLPAAHPRRPPRMEPRLQRLHPRPRHPRRHPRRPNPTSPQRDRHIHQILPETQHPVRRLRLLHLLLRARRPAARVARFLRRGRLRLRHGLRARHQQHHHPHHRPRARGPRRPLPLPQRHHQQRQHARRVPALRPAGHRAAVGGLREQHEQIRRRVPGAVVRRVREHDRRVRRLRGRGG